MKKLPPDEIKTIAAKIKADYAYMDKLSLKGWMWEFIRRSQSYINLCDEIQDIVRIEKKLSKRRVTGYIFKCLGDYNMDTQTLERIPRDKNISKCYIVIRESKSNQAHFIPKYEKRFIDFGDELLFDILGTEPFKINEDVPDVFDLSSPERASKCFAIIMDLSIIYPDNTIYVGISKAAKIDDLENKLLPALRTRLMEPEAKKTRMRTNKWKNYLICYDLKKTYKAITYETIADIMIGTDYSMKISKSNNKSILVPLSDVFDANTMKNYCSYAEDLIDRKYKDYFYDGRQ